VGFVEGETGYCSETSVMCDVGGTEEFSIDFEEAIDIKEEVIKVEEEIHLKDEVPEAISFPPIKTEPEVRLWGVCEVVAAHAFRPFICPQKEIVKLNLTISCLVLYCLSNIPLESGLQS
jgi:hypothetical protein